MQRQQPGRAGLGAGDGEHPGIQVDGVASKPQRFADPQARDRHQPEEGLVGGGAQRRPQRAGCLRAGVRSRRRSRCSGSGRLPWPGKTSALGDLGGRVDRAQVGGESADRAQPVTPGHRVDSDRLAGPGDGQFRGDRGRAGGLQVGGEPRKDDALTVELEAQRAPQPQIVLDMAGPTRHSLRCSTRRSSRTASRRRRCRGPGLGERPQLVHVHPRVTGGADRAAVPQNLADLRQRNLLTDHHAGHRVPQPVRADRPDPGPRAGPPHDQRHRLRESTRGPAR